MRTKTGDLQRTYYQGKADIIANLPDYPFIAKAFIDIYDLTGETGNKDSQCHFGTTGLQQCSLPIARNADIESAPQTKTVKPDRPERGKNTVTKN